jgi:FtsH-binding integral membrane protein
LILGFTLYFISPIIQAFRQEGTRAGGQLVFFGVIHISAMLLAVVLVTVGSAMAKRQPTDHAKFRTMLIWFSIGLVVIFLAIPWPFSPLANRPYIRTFQP